jgi:hypothetical protein
LKKQLIAVLAAAIALSAVGGTSAHAEEPERSPRGNKRVEWDYQGGTPTAVGDSADSVKKSNAYHFDTVVYDGDGNPVSGGGYVYPAGYEPTVAAGSWDFSYKASELEGAGQIFFAVLSVDTGYPTLFFLDPAHCPGVGTGIWRATNFQRTGADCTIYDADGDAHTGTDASAGDDATFGTGDDVAATSAWSSIEEEFGEETTWAFVTAQASEITVDRVKVSGNVLSEYRTQN